ncbi:hypothetical protein X777_12791 [Ooceraea biroi]|uniref:Monocarboxylate transporter n=1 Tax=Ooceraea biroi TaxID=2015173 RepID=A0A026W1Z6_OOCBI|nr:hypothetical protein X777_12791 [Ooceraea biroi]
MDGRADSAGSPCEEAYRRRRRSYSAAMSDENSLDDDDEDEDDDEDDDDDDDGAKEEEAYPHHDGAARARCCRRHECSTRKISSLESETCCSIESLVSKRALTRESSGDTAKSWSEIEIPELLLAHPEILSRMMRCRCFVAQFSACQCQHQRRKISSTSSCLARESGAKRKDSGNSVSTCQSFLPPSSGRNSVGSLYCCTDNAGDNAGTTTTTQRRHSIAAGPVLHRRYSSDNQTHPLLRGYKIGRADNRRLSEQSLVADAIGNRESVAGAASVAEPIIAGSRTRFPRGFPKATARATQSVASFHRESSARDIKRTKDNESRIVEESLGARILTDSCGKNSEANANSFTGRKNSAIPITPKMMRRRFSEQLILEGGLASASEFENLVGQPEQAENEEESLTAINARKKITLNKHYYPEGGWGYVIVVTTILVHLISHGLQLASGLLMSSAVMQYKRTIEDAGTTYKTSVLQTYLKINYRNGCT